MTELKKILVVDDEEDVIAYLSLLITDLGHVPLKATSVRRAREIVSHKTPDLILLDITMPEDSGIRFLHDMEISESLSQIPVVIVTGTDINLDDLRSQHGIEKNIAALIEKPIDRELFISTIQNLIG